MRSRNQQLPQARLDALETAMAEISDLQSKPNNINRPPSQPDSESIVPFVDVGAPPLKTKPNDTASEISDTIQLEDSIWDAVNQPKPSTALDWRICCSL